ncbi:serine--tRNA ligase [uncultured Mailhella sp.]|uniref:serine--tRNA ligase n=1 Tax=uncultured Mailhella sp. TaxID=1981031 RepID=UPI002625F3C4|nr:serine--tRNA ligase [uncultured Mailhella sp.]
MLDLKLLQKQPEVVAKALADRHSPITIDEFLELDARRRAALTEVETLKSRRNAESGEVARRKRAGEDATELVAELGKLSARIKELDAEADEIKEKVYQWMLRVPNIPDASVPVGVDERDNPELHRWGKPRDFGFTPKQHFEVGAARTGLDFERGAKLAGSRFCVSHGVFARLERALMNFYLDTQTTEFGATEILPPFMVNAATMQGTGQLPKFEEDLFKMPAWDYYLIPTAEVPVTNLHAGEILEESQLPLRYTAGTPCFRSEAGSAGKDVRGLIRQHQFIKVEMVRFAHPGKSWEELEHMRRCAEILLEKLELPYRTITLCTGDMGFGSAKTYDVEVWLPGQNVYREISSCSNCVDFQARRANIRFRPKGGGKPEFVHTLNGSGLPTGRSLVAVIENYQEEDGSIVIPKVLRPYMGGLEVIRPDQQ